VCGSGEVEDEEHFLLGCRVLEGARNRMWESARAAVEACGGEAVWRRFVGLGRSEKVDVMLSGWWEGCEREAVWRVLEQTTRHGMWGMWKVRMAALGKPAADS
jgi:hypothetical protein